ncbi:MAG: protein-disulfide reductase DsbD domain-containing protein [Planctomycetota bacterium]|jgi:thiol:disulfide interchange protein DsbD
MRAGRLATPTAVALGLAVLASAQTRPSLSAEQVSRLRVIADREVVGPGETFRLAVVFDLAPKWHVYWKNPGAGGLPPRIRVTAPDGYRVGEPQFTRPRIFPSPIGDEYGYYDEAVIFVPLHAPQALDDGRLHIEVAVDWAVCKEICLLGRASRDVVLKTAGRRSAKPPAPPEVIGRHEKRLPRPLRDLEGATLAFDGTSLHVEGPASGTRRVTFFPQRAPGVVYRDVHAIVDRFHTGFEGPPGAWCSTIVHLNRVSDGYPIGA